MVVVDARSERLVDFAIVATVNCVNYSKVGKGVWVDGAELAVTEGDNVDAFNDDQGHLIRGAECIVVDVDIGDFVFAFNDFCASTVIRLGTPKDQRCFSRRRVRRFRGRPTKACYGPEGPSNTMGRGGGERAERLRRDPSYEIRQRLPHRPLPRRHRLPLRLRRIRWPSLAFFSLSFPLPCQQVPPWHAATGTTSLRRRGRGRWTTR